MLTGYRPPRLELSPCAALKGRGNSWFMFVLARIFVVLMSDTLHNEAKTIIMGDNVYKRKDNVLVCGRFYEILSAKILEPSNTTVLFLSMQAAATELSTPLYKHTLVGLLLSCTLIQRALMRRLTRSPVCHHPGDRVNRPSALIHSHLPHSPSSNNSPETPSNASHIQGGKQVMTGPPSSLWSSSSRVTN